MKVSKKNIVLTILLTILGIVWVNSNIFAQVKVGNKSIQSQLRDMKIQIPFVDKDGDGINDLMQNGWGLRFLKQYQNRRAAWDQLEKGQERSNKMIDTNGDGVPDTKISDMMEKRRNEMVDTNGDGVPDKQFGEHMKTLMEQLIDTDGDGVPDTPLKDYMRKNFQLFDNNGDGIPDKLSLEDMRNKFKEMREWREKIRDNLRNGRPAFVDENGDGIPDNLPEGFGWMKRRKRRGGRE